MHSQALFFLFSLFAFASCGGSGGTEYEHQYNNTGGSQYNNTGDTTSSSSSGVVCQEASDCAYNYCICNFSSTPVNSRSCNNKRCASASNSCPSACAALGDTWSGRVYSSNSSSTPNPTGSSSSDTGLGYCSIAADCAWHRCGCTDGAASNVRDCYNSYCSSKRETCISYCEDYNHGTWDGY